MQSESGERDGNQEMLISVPGSTFLHERFMTTCASEARNTFLNERFMKTVHLKQTAERMSHAGKQGLNNIRVGGSV